MNLNKIKLMTITRTANTNTDLTFIMLFEFNIVIGVVGIVPSMACCKPMLMRKGENSNAKDKQRLQTD